MLSFQIPSTSFRQHSSSESRTVLDGTSHYFASGTAPTATDEASVLNLNVASTFGKASSGGEVSVSLRSKNAYFISPIKLNFYCFDVAAFKTPTVPEEVQIKRR